MAAAVCLPCLLCLPCCTLLKVKLDKPTQSQIREGIAKANIQKAIILEFQKVGQYRINSLQNTDLSVKEDLHTLLIQGQQTHAAVHRRLKVTLTRPEEWELYDWLINNTNI